MGWRRRDGNKSTEQVNSKLTEKQISRLMDFYLTFTFEYATMVLEIRNYHMENDSFLIGK